MRIIQKYGIICWVIALILKRKIYNKLLEWKNECVGTKALLIEGARRIGKSTICEYFAKKEYKSYIIIDFAKKNKQIEEYFEKYLDDLDTLFMFLQVHYGVKFYERQTLIIFDEVQMFPLARASIKYLVKDGRYDYLETGSLISIRENVKNIVIPSEERSINMYPLDFEEFCVALGEENLFEYIKNCYTQKKALEKNLHERAMLVFKQYMLVGGMPKPVISFIENSKDFTIADKEKRDILKLYRNDIMKINSNYREKVISIFDQLPGILSQHEKRVVFNRIEEKSYALQYEETFFWLADSMVCNECFMCSDPNVGLAINEIRSYIKCYMSDTGLLVSLAFSENELMEHEVYKQILLGKLNMNKGMLYENVIAQMLKSNGHKLYFYTSYNKEKHRNDIEIDFLISNNSKLNYKISPIEVKSGKRYTIKSMSKFIEKYKERINMAYIIHPKNLRFEDNILYIPPYMTIFISK